LSAYEGFVPPPTTTRRRWLILVALVSSLIVVIMDNTILNVALPTISRDLGASQAELTGAILSYAVVFGSLQFSAGVLGDRYGRKRVLLLGMTLFGLSSLLASFASDPNQLIVYRAVMAIGASMVPAQTLSILTNVFPPEERPKAIGIWTAFTGASLAVGPVIGGFLLEHFWWGSIFFINVPIVIVTAIAVGILVPETRNPSPGRLDPGGIALSIVGLGALLFGLIYGADQRDWSSFYSTGLILTGIGFLALFVWYEAHIDHPSFDVRFFKNPRFSAASAATAFAFFALFGVTFFLTFYYQFVKGLTPIQAGLAVLPVGIAQVIFAPRAPKVVRRIGPKYTVAMGLTILAISLGGYVFVQADDPIYLALILTFITGTGMAHIVAPSTESVMSTLPPQNAGAGSAANNTVRQVSGALGIAVFGSVLQIVYGRQITDALEVLPEGVRDQASRSIGDTTIVLGQLAQQDPAAAATARQALACGEGQLCAVGNAFMAGVHVTAILAAAVALIGVAIVLRFLPMKSAPMPTHHPAAAPQEGAQAAPARFSATVDVQPTTVSEKDVPDDVRGLSR
jgi:DHA2 family multidrug resistance protein-like MFS transporter